MDNEHSLCCTDLYLTQVSSCSPWNKLWEIGLENCTWVQWRPWKLFTACFVGCRPLTVISVTLVFCSKFCITEKAISQGKSYHMSHLASYRVEAEFQWCLMTLSCLLQSNACIMKLIQYQYKCIKQIHNTALPHRLDGWRTNVLRTLS